MNTLKRLIFNHFWIKLFAAGLATGLWAIVAVESISEISISVPLEFRNIPVRSEIVGESGNTTVVRLRGPSRLVRNILPADVSATIDLSTIGSGDRVISLSAQNVTTPFGIDVVNVTPATIRLRVEPTAAKSVPVEPVLSGRPAEGFRVSQSKVSPPMAEITGPQNTIKNLQTIQTAPINIKGKKETFVARADLKIGRAHV